eukprot:1281105-Amphidinium_carterae.1
MPCESVERLMSILLGNADDEGIIVGQGGRLPDVLYLDVELRVHELDELPHGLDRVLLRGGAPFLLEVRCGVQFHRDGGGRSHIDDACFLTNFCLGACKMPNKGAEQGRVRSPSLSDEEFQPFKNRFWELVRFLTLRRCNEDLGVTGALQASCRRGALPSCPLLAVTPFFALWLLAFHLCPCCPFAAPAAALVAAWVHQ